MDNGKEIKVDAASLQNGLLKVEGDGWAEGEEAAYEFTESVEAPGENTNNKFEIVWNENAAEKNYEIIRQYGTLSISNVMHDLKSK